MRRAEGRAGRSLTTWLGLLLLALVGVTACGGAEAAPGGGEAESTRLRIGYFPNMTHAPAIVGLEQGLFAEHLGDGVTLETATFNAGGEAVEALFSGAIDLTYIGPNPAINGYAQSDGEAVRLIAGATSGGAFLVVRPGIEDAQDLRGARLSSPALGNTQDAALRAWLAEQGLVTDLQGGGDVSILPQANAQILETFRAGQIDGAWVPEPWATRLINEGGGVVLVDERDLWPGGQYVTTHVLVDTGFLAANPDLVTRFLRGHVAAVDYVNEQPAEAQSLVLAAIERITGASLSADVMAEAWDNLEFTVDPIASSLQKSADDAAAQGLLDPIDLDGIYDLALLNGLLVELGREGVSAR